MKRMLGMILAVAAASVLAAQSAAAATVPAHNSPRVYCWNGGEIDVDLPTMVSTPYRSEPVWVLFHLFKRVNGIWQHQIAGDHYFSNYATFGGALLGGWLPDGNASIWGAYQDDFYVSTTGEYHVAMEMWWTYSGAHAYEWTGATCTYS
jgi:hypothetical protein